MAPPARPHTTTVALLHGVWVCLTARSFFFLTMRHVLWDVAGGDSLSEINRGYLQGAHALIFVVDGTRYTSYEAVQSIQAECSWTGLDVPYVVLFNKKDLSDQWVVPIDSSDTWSEQCVEVFQTSAKDGSNVDEAFHTLARALIKT